MADIDNISEMFDRWIEEIDIIIVSAVVHSRACKGINESQSSCIRCISATLGWEERTFDTEIH
jgi:hypothetical protein